MRESSMMHSSIQHTLRKLRSTIRIVTILFCARTFGQYIHSVGDVNGLEYAVYDWRGERWAFPTKELDNV